MALYLVIRVGAVLSRLLPRSWRYLIAAAVGEAVLLVWGTKRRIVRDNMAQVTGLSSRDPRVRLLAKRSMRNYCKYLIEFLELPTLSSRDPAVAGMRLSGIEHLHHALARGKGVILATGHFGSIELPGLRLRDFTDFHAVYDTFRPAYLDHLIQRKRREKGIDLIPVSNVRKMLRVLQAGGTLAILFDRPMTTGGGTPVRFFGRNTEVPAGPAVLAMKTGAALIPVYVTRQPDKSFDAVLYAPVQWSPSGDRNRDVGVVMQKLMDTLQSAVRSRPDQWYMFRPMWPDRGEAAPARGSSAQAPEPGA